MEPRIPIPESIPQLAPDIPASAFAADYVLMAAISIIGAVVLLIGIGLLLWKRHRRCHASPPLSPEAVALAALDGLEADMPPLRPCALRLSYILRSFLSGQTEDPALYETHEEFSHRIDSLSGLPAACRHDMRCLLEDLAELKYVPDAADDGAERLVSLISRARELVLRTAAEQAREAAERSKD